MNVSFDLSALNRTKWHEYAVSFLFGGLVTVGAGLIAKKFGPLFGGLFLAFPAIFPAGATLVEKHERKKEGTRGNPEYQAWPASSRTRLARRGAGQPGPGVFRDRRLEGISLHQRTHRPGNCASHLDRRRNGCMADSQKSILDLRDTCESATLSVWLLASLPSSGEARSMGP
jgi:hypothetical protein